MFRIAVTHSRRACSQIAAGMASGANHRSTGSRARSIVMSANEPAPMIVNDERSENDERCAVDMAAPCQPIIARLSSSKQMNIIVS